MMNYWLPLEGKLCIHGPDAMLCTEAAAVFRTWLINAATHRGDLGDAVLGDVGVRHKHNPNGSRRRQNGRNRKVAAADVRALATVQLDRGKRPIVSAKTPRRTTVGYLPWRWQRRVVSQWPKAAGISKRAASRTRPAFIQRFQHLFGSLRKRLCKPGMLLAISIRA